MAPGGPNQVGLAVDVDLKDSRKVSVSVDASVVGDVVLYASYNSTKGKLILGRPKLVASIPTGATLTGLELRPDDIPLPLGISIPLEVRGTYKNGVSRPFFVVGNPQFVFTSTASSVVTVDEDGVLSAVGAGTAKIQVSYQGLSATTTISVPASPQATLKDATLVSGSKLRFQIDGLDGASYVIQTSPDLSTWKPVATNTAPASVELDIISGNRAAFYRAERLP